MATVPSLALIPSAYKASKVYSVIPSNGDGDFTFTRNSSATRVNSNGLIESIGVNVPRLDYSNGNCPSLLLEPQRTNLVTYSEDTTEWDKNETPINTSNTTISPNGYRNADSVIVNSISEGFYDFSIGTVNSGASYTFSIFIKHISGIETIRFGGSGGGFGGDNNNVFNIKNGTVVSAASGNTLSVDDYGNGWYRLIATKTASSTSTAAWVLYGNENAEIQYSAWGAQLEQGSYATSYIPTNGSIATRIVETCNDAGNASTFNDSEGVLMAEISALADDGVNKFISISDGSISNRINIVFDTSNNINARQAPGSVNISTSGINILNSNKIAYKYQSGSQELWVNGFKIGETSVSNLPSGLDRLNFDSFNGGDNFFGKVKQLQYFDTALTDTELQELTTL